MSRDLIERLQQLAAAGDPDAALALEREARRRGDVATEQLARARRAVGGEVSWEALKSCLDTLQDPDPELRALAVEELSGLPLSAQALCPPLLGALGDAAACVRVAAAFALTWVDAPDIHDGLCALLVDPDLNVRDQAAASLVGRLSNDLGTWSTWRDRFNAFIVAYRSNQPSPPPETLVMERLSLDIFPMEVQPPARVPLPSPDTPLGWACAVTDALGTSVVLGWMPDGARATLGRYAPLTALSLLTEAHLTRRSYGRDWDQYSGFVLIHHVGVPSEVLIARLRAQSASDLPAERAAAAMAWSELMASPSVHTRALQALADLFASHPDPAVRRFALPGRLLRAGLPEAKFNLFAETLRDPDCGVRVLALALVNGLWQGPWNPAAGEVYRQRPRDTALDRVWPPPIFGRIWTVNAINDAASLGLASTAIRDPERAVRLQALAIFAHLTQNPANANLHPMAQNALRAAASHDPDRGLRAIARWLCDGLHLTAR